MPLVSGKKARTKKGFSENIEREMEAGKPQKQAVAIAYSQARKAKKKKPWCTLPTTKNQSTYPSKES